MVKNNYNVVGLMSGTSLDGIDLAHCAFTLNGHWEFKLSEVETYPYPADWVEKLKNLISYSHEELKQLDEDYTIFLAEIIQSFIHQNKLSSIDAVCSHGHTALHQPEKGMTYQIGNLPKLATLIDQTVVCDFRVEDVALGGQGAPLVPIGDQLLFSNYNYCVNLGGFANISSEIGGQRIAYDICPVNIVLNHYVDELGLHYDRDGDIAKSGTIHSELLQQLNALSYYSAPYPKSLGLEWVKAEIFPLINALKLPIKDILRTFVEHIVIQISAAVKNQEDISVLFTGGGAYNAFLMERLSNSIKNQIVIPESSLVEYKEALIFAFLGVLKLRNEINCFSSVTGAQKDHSSGKIYYP